MQAIGVVEGRILVQPWLGVLGSIGKPPVEPVLCDAPGRAAGQMAANTCAAANAVGHRKLERIMWEASRLELIGNQTSSCREVLCHVRPFRASPTSHLVRTPAGLLGVAHVHRGRGTEGIGPQDPHATRQYGYAPHEGGGHAPFQFGYDYTHFFYLLEPTVPHRLVAASAEFCIASQQNEDDCESVQLLHNHTSNWESVQLVCRISKP